MIEVRHLTRYYGSFAALEDVSFEIREGEIIGLLGLNGAGKSTTLKILAGLITPSEGEVKFEGHDVTENPEAVRSRIGYLPESPPLYKDMTVSAFLTHIGRLKGMSAADVQRRLPSVIELAQLQGREDQIIDTLSHGYRKRVGIAQAVLHDPRLVILDEPISGLDPRQIVGMREVIRGLADKRGVIVSSHILSEISQTCDRILVIDGGRLVAQGTEAELAERAGGGERRIQITVKGDEARFVEWLAAHPAVEAAKPLLATHPGTAVAHVELKERDGRA
ncbi:MAG: ABC transporter ATP-binding protein, partial [Myxococcales bacterium]|nr:ABC transporter ATP-binding protein [Myxococcales bacterium]